MSPLREMVSRLFVAVLAICAAGQAWAEMPDLPPARYPALASSGSEAAAFAPKDWTVEAQAAGDLNRDGLADIAFVLREQDKAKRLPVSGRDPERTWDSNPRILAVAFAEPDGRGYRLALENHTLIPRRESPNHEDPFEDAGSLAIKRGAVSVTLHLFSSAGGADMGNTTLTFRHRDGRFELIGYDAANVHRMSGKTRDTSVNFLTGRMRLSTGSISDDKLTVQDRKLPPAPLPTIEAVGDGLAYEPPKPGR